MIIPWRCVSAKPKSNAQVHPAHTGEAGLAANSDARVLARSTKLAVPTADTCTDTLPSVAETISRSMPMVSGFELSQVPVKPAGPSSAAGSANSTRSKICTNTIDNSVQEALIQLRII